MMIRDMPIAKKIALWTTAKEQLNNIDEKKSPNATGVKNISQKVIKAQKIDCEYNHL